MHVMVGVEILHSRTNVSKVSPNYCFTELSVSELNPLMKSATKRVLKHHVCCVLIFLVVIIDQFDDVRMVKLVMHLDLILSVLVINQLNRHHFSVFSVTCQPHLTVRPKPNHLYPSDFVLEELIGLVLHFIITAML